LKNKIVTAMGIPFFETPCARKHNEKYVSQVFSYYTKRIVGLMTW
jgi:hypothetical protein